MTGKKRKSAAPDNKPKKRRQVKPRVRIQAVLTPESVQAGMVSGDGKVDYNGWSDANPNNFQPEGRFFNAQPPPPTNDDAIIDSAPVATTNEPEVVREIQVVARYEDAPAPSTSSGLAGVLTAVPAMMIPPFGSVARWDTFPMAGTSNPNVHPMPLYSVPSENIPASQFPLYPNETFPTLPLPPNEVPSSADFCAPLPWDPFQHINNEPQYQGDRSPSTLPPPTDREQIFEPRPSLPQPAMSFLDFQYWRTQVGPAQAQDQELMQPQPQHGFQAGLQTQFQSMSQFLEQDPSTHQGTSSTFGVSPTSLGSPFELQQPDRYYSGRPSSVESGLGMYSPAESSIHSFPPDSPYTSASYNLPASPSYSISPAQSSYHSFERSDSSLSWNEPVLDFSASYDGPAIDHPTAPDNSPLRQVSGPPVASTSRVQDPYVSHRPTARRDGGYRFPSRFKLKDAPTPWPVSEPQPHDLVGREESRLYLHPFGSEPDIQATSPPEQYARGPRRESFESYFDN